MPSKSGKKSLPLDEHVTRLPTTATWHELAIAGPFRKQLRLIETEAGAGGRGLTPTGQARGVTALFSGPRGTDKTLAAQCLANALGRDLYRVDLAGVTSKHLGETEKRLSRIFDAAQASGAVLLLDEADALFGKRPDPCTDVKDSHDRYARLEVDDLLQRVEGFEGLAILTTNRKQALDPAFLRRLRYVVEFPPPTP